MHGNIRIKIFTRYPVPGKVKTRLIPTLSPQKATRLHQLMTEHVLDVAREFCRQERFKSSRITVCYTGAKLAEFKAWLGHDLSYEPQSSGGLGFRMSQAFKKSFEQKGDPVVLIGSDLPGLNPQLLVQAFQILKDSDMVLGPAADGGYYLIGMKSFHPELFQDIDWGTKRVYNQTTEIIRNLELDFKDLPTLKDLDRPEDLDLLDGHPGLAGFSIERPLLSIIIPTLNEERMLPLTLDRLHCGRSIEVIVVDGGSQDRTCQIALQDGARLAEVCEGRYAQQNKGAAMARGEIVLFLHADTILPYGYDELIRTALNDSATVAGAFRLQIDDPRRSLRLVEFFANLRSSVLKLPYADQGLFMKKRLFDQVGGLASLPIMEDFELVLRLRRVGSLVTLDRPALTSARRWQEIGVLPTTVINQVMVLGFMIGIPVERLKNIYRSNKKLLSRTKD